MENVQQAKVERSLKLYFTPGQFRACEEAAQAERLTVADWARQALMVQTARRIKRGRRPQFNEPAGDAG